MATINGSDAADNTAIFDDIAKFNGASDGVYAVGTTTDEDANVSINLDLSTVSALTDLACSLVGYVTNGGAALNLSQANFRDSMDSDVLQLTPGAFRTTAGSTALDLSSLSLAQVQSIAKVQFLFSDGGTGGGTLRLDSLTVTYTPAATSEESDTPSRTVPVGSMADRYRSMWIEKKWR